MPTPHASPLLTDLYELTMLAGYHAEGMLEEPAVFDLFFRDNPFQGGYAVFAGLGPVLDYLEGLRFTDDDLAYLQSLQLFAPVFLDYLRTFRFRGRVSAPPEGTVVFAHEPLLTVEGTLAESQFVETALLNAVNFQTLVATKAARIAHAAAGKTVIEFGLRRAQGPDGGLSVARAAAVGGITSTSNVLAGQRYGLPVKGTHAHSWVMAFADELTAFRAYAAAFPDHCILLVDTFDTLTSGIPNAIIVARELRAAGHELRGIRLDSGDLAWLSREARRLFNAAGFPAVQIVASNELDEQVIEAIRAEGGCIDIYGVGTRLATCAGDGGGALGGVYKLVECSGIPRMKTTSDITKATLPGRKEVWRVLDANGTLLLDVIACPGEELRPEMTVYDPTNPARHLTLPEGMRLKPLREPVLDAGRRLRPDPSLATMTGHCKTELTTLPEGCLRILNPHRYKVAISPALHHLRESLMAQQR